MNMKSTTHVVPVKIYHFKRNQLAEISEHINTPPHQVVVTEVELALEDLKNFWHKIKLQIS